MTRVETHLNRKKVAPRVLVVDDESYARTTVCRWLTRAGYQCDEAASIGEAMTRLHDHETHLLTLDISLPDRSGLEILSQIKQHWPDTEILVLTALEETATAVEAMTLGAYSYLLKPLESRELILQAKKALEHRDLIVKHRHYTATLEAKVHQQMQAIRCAHEETILRLLSASRYRDEETGTHVRRTGLYCELFTEVLGWPPDQVQNIRLAAPMHDLGKIGIPDAILQKPSKLTPEEFAVMKTHTVIGAQMLEGSESEILQMAHEIAMWHHERWDGTGYPQGLVGLATPESARILALVDVYDALTHHRVYHEALPEDQALEIMEQGCGRHFDPFLFSIFLSLLPEFRRIAQQNTDDRVDSYKPSRANVLARPR
ncbi:MAG: HD domain-containing phosphohydrolase [Planctomycetota bacterium]